MFKSKPDQPDHLMEANLLFHEKATKSFKKLFELAKAKNELHFAFSLAAEFRGTQSPGWNTAQEAHVAFREYFQFITTESDTPNFRARVALAFYCHLAEASGFYEIPKNLLRVADGERYKAWPFLSLVKKHRVTGEMIAPNANKVLQDLAGHAQEVGLTDLAEVFRDAFDSDIRNGYAHADYVVWTDGLRLPKRNGGDKRIVTWPEFKALVERGMNFFKLLGKTVKEYRDSYNPPKKVQGQSSDAPECTWTIYLDPEKKTLTFFC